MDIYQIPFSKIEMDKTSISFSWDDNFIRHYEVISKIFEYFNLRCTFYINVGDCSFSKQLENNYHVLSKNGFEIGSHGFNHISMNLLSDKEFLLQISLSIETMENKLKVRPTTFAFPHHQNTIQQIDIINSFFLTTRNDLHNSKRISLKSDTSIEQIFDYIHSLLYNKTNIVFSGHSIQLYSDIQQGIIDGYEPIKIDLLYKLISYVKLYSSISEIITIEQAAIKEYIKKNCKYTKSYCIFSEKNLSYLASIGFNINKLKKII